MQKQSEHRQMLYRMTDKVQMALDRGVIAESDFPGALREPVSQAASRLINQQKRPGRLGDSVNDFTGGAIKRVGDVIGMVMGTCEDEDFGHVATGMTACLGTGEGTRQGRENCRPGCHTGHRLFEEGWSRLGKM